MPIEVGDGNRAENSSDWTPREKLAKMAPAVFSYDERTARLSLKPEHTPWTVPTPNAL